ncbi:MAG: F0F1 ATP synthase subunit B' [Rhizobiales bacterium]|nr:F0F1 ATP synthase subunit B' [Hyphomicrobiales bacterium]MBI3673619.1 F0F1 ATP synthase subunit B' [Hyphomicrobiales bacterium]
MAEPKVGMPQLDPTAWPTQLFWLAVTFVALYIVISRIVIPRTGGAIAKRKSTIDGNLAAAQQLKERADKAVAAYEAQLAEARQRADGIAKENYATLAAEITEVRGKLDRSLIAMIGDAEKRVGAAKARALADVNAVAAEIAANIVSELVGIAVSAGDAAAAVAKAAK